MLSSIGVVVVKHLYISNQRRIQGGPQVPRHRSDMIGQNDQSQWFLNLLSNQAKAAWFDRRFKNH